VRNRWSVLQQDNKLESQ